MKSKIVLIAGVSLFTVLSGCASTAGNTTNKSTQATYDERCKFPGTAELAPSWICEPLPGWEVTAKGVGEPTAAGYAFQEQMAMTAGRVALAQQFKIYVANRITQVVGTTGTAKTETVDQAKQSATNLITEQTLTGSRVVKSVQGPDGKLWVLMGLDSSAVENLTQSAVKTSMKNDNALWQQFQAKKGLDELATEIAKQKVAESAAK